MFDTTYDVALTSNGEILTIGTDVCEVEMVNLKEQFLWGWTIEDWEEKFPKLKESRTNNMVLSIYNNSAGDETRFEGRRIWTWAKASDYESTDGWCSAYEITKYPICFIEEFSDLVYGLKEEKGHVDWYAFHFKDNQPKHTLPLNLRFGSKIVTPHNRVANIRMDGCQINWGFECVNGLLNFKAMCREHTIDTGRDGRKYIPIHYNLCMGAWMEDNLQLSVLKDLIKEEIKVGEDECLERFNGSIVFTTKTS